MSGLFTLLALAACDGTSKGVETEPSGLWIPPLLEGDTFDLTLSESSKTFLDGDATPTYGYNGEAFWGPTLRMTRGDAVQMNVTNDLRMDETTAHWHGFHLPAAADGGPHQPIAPGETWSPSFTVLNQAGTYWYHPHLHMMTMEQLAMGAGGLILVDDDEEAALALPRTYGVDDLPLVLTSRSFNDDNTFDTEAVYGDVMVTNGTPSAFVTLPASVVRLRILNAETERSYNLGFSDDRTFWVIATDGGLVDAPVPVTRLPLSVGERYEVLVDLTDLSSGDALDLQSFNGGQAQGFPGGEPNQSGEFGSLLNNTTFDVLHINVGAPLDGGVDSIPSTLITNDLWGAADATVERTVTITDEGPGSPFTFDNQGYDEEVINQYVRLGDTEKWTITNNRTFGHSFHIHDVQFSIVSRSSGEVAEHERGWKDTVFLSPNERVSFVARFEDFASATDPYMYHCHMANHEDGGLMGQFLVE